MDERDWTLLSLIGQNLSLSDIAKKFYMSQPALSYRIKKIETYFNAELLLRDNRRLQITPQGEQVIDFANKYLNNIEILQETIYSLDSEPKGPLRIGASNAIAQYLLPNILSEYHSLHPKVDLNLVTGFSDSLVDLLKDNQIHIAFLRDDIKWNFYKRKLLSENIYLVSKYPINIKELPSLPRITYKTNPSLKELISNWWTKRFDVPPKITMTVDDAGACKEIVRTGLGYAILPSLTLENTDELYKIPLKKNSTENLKRDTWVYANKSAEEYITAKAFLSFLISD